MNRLKLLAAIALLGLPLAACEEATPPPPVGSIMGQVSIEGQGIDGVSVTLSNGAATSTAGGGTYRFDNVEGGTYTVNISGFPADASFDATSGTATIGASGETATVNFSGSYIRTASVMGTVTVENKGLGGVTVRLTGMADATTATDNSGQYAFTGLRAGTYSVEISGFDTDDVGFSNTAKSATVGVGESQVITFEGTYLRTAGIMGQVSVEGAGIEGVTVNLSGGEEDATTRTDASGQYAFAKLRAGDYSVGISGYDSEEYEFEVTSKSVSVALGETANVPFEGNLLRTAGISGRVAVEGTGIEGVTVTLSGAGDGTAATNASGQYGFAGLVEGDYTVAISGYDDNAYSFETESADVTVGDSESKIQNFDGSHTTTASVSGQMFIDWTGDDMFNAGEEDPLAMAGVPISLQGPGVNDLRAMVTGEDGSYMFADLKAGDYRVLMDPTGAAAPAIAAAGLSFSGTAAGMTVTVAAGGSETANFPFDITHQTITVKAALGDNGVEGVGVDLYATFQDADGGTKKLGSAMSDATGTASFTFLRAADVGPAGTPDQLVFSKVSSLPHADLSITANETMEISYAKRKQASEAPEPVSLVNRRANVRFWVKTIETPSGGGDEVQEGWATEAKFDPDDTGTKAGTDSDASGMASFTDGVSVGDLPKTYYLSVGGPSDDGGEAWDATAEPDEGVTADGMYLMYVHDGLQMPGETADLGTIRVKWTTQTLVVGAHRERDQEEGYATYDILTGGDARPAADQGGEFELMMSDTNGRLRTYEVADAKHDLNTNENPRAVGTDGLATFKNLPSDMNFTVRYTVEKDRKIVGDTEVDTWQNQGDNSVGAFGDDGGTGNMVQLCPLAPDAKKANCSTAAYIWTDGTVSGNVTSKDYDGDGKGEVSPDSLKVNLTPSGNLSSGGGGTEYSLAAENGGYEFTNVPDGVYMVSVTGSEDWGNGPGKRVHVNRGTENAGDGFKLELVNFLLTFINTSISGTVVNDTDQNGRVTGADAAEAGVKLTLFDAKKDGKKGASTGRTAMTDASGAFSFTGVTEGGYIVEANGGDYFVSSGETVGTQSPVLTTTAVTAKRSISSGTGAKSLPKWNYESSTVANKKTDADFILLYNDGEISGKVQEKDDKGVLQGVVTDVEVYICVTADASKNQCTTYGNKSRPVDTVTTDAKGEYVFDGFREGYYEVSPRVPAGKKTDPQVVLVSGREDSQPGVDFTIQ